MWVISEQQLGGEGRRAWWQGSGWEWWGERPGRMGLGQVGEVPNDLDLHPGVPGSAEAWLLRGNMRPVRLEPSEKSQGHQGPGHWPVLQGYPKDGAVCLRLQPEFV